MYNAWVKRNLALWLVGAVVFISFPISAATITVTSTADSGAGSLRQAIADANPGDTIDFSVTGTITLTSGELLIQTGPLTIQGPGADQLMIDGNSSSRIFHIAAGVDAAISGLTVAWGLPDSGGGGAVRNEGVLELIDCTVRDSIAQYGNGGGIYNAGTMSIMRCTISGSYSTDNGGGIYNAGTMSITNSTISDNIGWWGSTDYGGGIYNAGTATLTVEDSTIAGNSADEEGGGIYNAAGGTAKLKNTIVADNTAPTGPDLDGTFYSYGYNLIEDTTDCTINEIENGGTDVIGQDPLLGPLQDNGGPTETRALLDGSPAIDAGSCTDIDGNLVADDQRGVTRPQPSAGACDIGAFEKEVPCSFSSYTVTKTDDSGEGSLRYAIGVVCPGGTIDFDLTYPATIVLTSGELTINKALTIEGPGQDQLTIDGNGSSRVFHITGSGNATISGVTVTGGNAGTDNGGGIYNEGTLTLEDATVTQNAADWGAGIYSTGELTVRRCTISDNSSEGIGTEGTATIEDSTISDNDSSGVFNKGTATIRRSTISGNISLDFGGGIYNDIDGTLTLINSTVSGNSTGTGTDYGGGIYNSGSATLKVSSSTIADNIAASDGGGVYNHSTGTAELKSTIIADNVSNAGSGNDLSGDFTSYGYNMIEDANGYTMNSTGTDKPGQDPQLQPLADNGGPTWTHALPSDSLAVDAGSGIDIDGNAVASDQRGVLRPQGGGWDIGAYEVEIACPNTYTVTNTDDSGEGSLRYAIEEVCPGGTIDFAVTGTILLTGGELLINKALTIQGPGADQLTIDGNNNSRVFHITGSGNATINGLTVEHGDAGSNSGGGIYNEGMLKLIDCAVSNSSGDFGGGIWNEGTAEFTGCTISGNSATKEGGGIENDGTLSLMNCTVSGNTGAGGWGGGGGGIDNSGTLQVEDSTIAENSTDYGGGIFNEPDGTVKLKNTIVADNFTTSSTSPDLGGEVDSYGYNLIKDPSDCTITGIENDGTDITGVDPLLGPLQDNGGPTFTQALLPGSPALDAGSCKDIDGNAVAADQRGIARPQGTACDIGAYEKVTYYTLTVHKAGTGSGTVKSSPAGIDCGGTCTAMFPAGTVVTLTAVPMGSSNFTGWSGDASGTDTTLQLTMNSNKDVTATFNLPGHHTLTVHIAGGGTGTVRSSPSGINCGNTCSASFDSGTVVTLTAIPMAGSHFTGWSGDVSSTNTSITVVMNADVNVTATFNIVGYYTLTVNKAGNGTGTVTSSPGGIDCGGICSASFLDGARITLTAAPDTGWLFIGWSGDTAGAGTTVTIVMDADKNITAKFGFLVPGDTNGDGTVDVRDVRLCLRIATGAISGTTEQRVAADVDHDGDVDRVDVQILAEYIIGIRTSLP